MSAANTADHAHAPSDLDRAVELLRHRTGVVVPTYFPENLTDDAGVALLGDTVRGFCRELADPRHLVLAVDGTRSAADVAARVAAATGVAVAVAPTNRGKLQAARLGALHLLDTHPDLELIAIIDQDGDHFANELLNLVRAARQILDLDASPGCLVLGRRISRHRPMGFLRGELEELADRVLLDALHYHAAKSGVPLPLQYATTLDEYPDFHSGYKVFSRAAAEATFRVEPSTCGQPDACAWRHAVEAVMTVEALLAGALLIQVNRSTYDEQPITTFGLMKRTRLVADKIIWPCKRLGVPAVFVDQWLRNHLPRLLLGSHVPQGADELRDIHSLVRQAFDLPALPATAGITRPRFL